MKDVPYALIRLVAGAVAVAWSIWTFASEGSVPTTFIGLLAFGAGWVIARRFGMPVRKTDTPPWLDTILPIAIAGFAVLPAALFPFLGRISIGAGAAITVMLLAGMSISLGLGPYANEKVGLKVTWTGL